MVAAAPHPLPTCWACLQQQKGVTARMCLVVLTMTTTALTAALLVVGLKMRRLQHWPLLLLWLRVVWQQQRRLLMQLQLLLLR